MDYLNMLLVYEREWKGGSKWIFTVVFGLLSGVGLFTDAFQSSFCYFSVGFL